MHKINRVPAFILIFLLTTSAIRSETLGNKLQKFLPSTGSSIVIGVLGACSIYQYLTIRKYKETIDKPKTNTTSLVNDFNFWSDLIKGKDDQIENNNLTIKQQGQQIKSLKQTIKEQEARIDQQNKQIKETQDNNIAHSDKYFINSNAVNGLREIIVKTKGEKQHNGCSITQLNVYESKVFPGCLAVETTKDNPYATSNLAVTTRSGASAILPYAVLIPGS